MSLKVQKKSKKIQEKNRSYKTKVRNQSRVIETLVKNNGELNELKTMIATVQKTLDKASNKGIIHKNKVARKKKKIFQLLNNYSR